MIKHDKKLRETANRRKSILVKIEIDTRYSNPPGAIVEISTDCTLAQYKNLLALAAAMIKGPKK